MLRSKKSKLSTIDLVNKLGHESKKAKAIIQKVNDNSSAWFLQSRVELKDGSGATREYQCIINGYICCHKIFTPMVKGKWGVQHNTFHTLGKPNRTFNHVFDMYDYLMTLPNGGKTVKAVKKQ